MNKPSSTQEKSSVQECHKQLDSSLRYLRGSSLNSPPPLPKKKKKNPIIQGKNQNIRVITQVTAFALFPLQRQHLPRPPEFYPQARPSSTVTNPMSNHPMPLYSNWSTETDLQGLTNPRSQNYCHYYSPMKAIRVSAASFYTAHIHLQE